MLKLNNLFLLLLFIITHHSFAIESNYQIKKNNGTVKFFAIGNPSAIRINGVGTAPEGNLIIDSNDKATLIKGNFEFDLTSLNTGIDMRDSHMKENYLEVAKFPNSKLVIDPIQINENISKASFSKTSEFKGKLFLHGEEKPIVGSTEIVSKNDQYIVFAKFKIKSSDFKIEVPSFAGITMGDEVDIEVEFNLQKSKI